MNALARAAGSGLNPLPSKRAKTAHHAEETAVLKIYGQARSRAFRVLWLCKESDIPYEHNPVSINVPNAQAKEDWYVKLNPNARVPTIDDDGFVMWESAAINLHLARKYQSPLWPNTVEGEGRALQWAFFIANDVEPRVVGLLQQRVMLPAEKRDAAIDAELDAELQPRLRVLEDQLDKAAYFGGDRWDLSDFMIASVLFTLVTLKFDLSKYPKLDAWLKATIARPKTQDAIKLRG